MADVPEMVRIKKIVEENPNVKTFFLDTEITAEPGQFMMLWIPELDEKPFAFSYMGDRKAVTVEKKGEFTSRLFEMDAGDRLGIRGPYGNGFPVEKNACVVAGGLGTAPLSPLIEKLDGPEIIIGAKCCSGLLFEDRFEGTRICTDDGSAGFEGFTTQMLEKVLKEKSFDVIYTCGPEIMMKKVFDICEREEIQCYASLERWMKCGFGVCGQCEINGYMVCKDGPVFGSEDLRKMDDFGRSARLKTGEKVPLNEYYSC